MARHFVRTSIVGLKFFGSKDRYSKLHAIVSKEDTAQDLDRKMLGVVVGASRPETFSIVRTLLHSIATNAGLFSNMWPPSWTQVERLELDGCLWRMVQQDFGYRAEEPNFIGLVSRMFVTDFGHHVRGGLPVELRELQLPEACIHNTVVFLALWRDSGNTGSSYSTWADQVWGLLNMAPHVHSYDVDDLLDVTTFAGVEGIIAQGITERLLGSAVTEAGAIRSIVDRRKDSHWISSVSVAQDRREARSAIYDALAAAAKILALRHTYSSGFDHLDAAALYSLYESELFEFDQLYRHFCLNADVASGHGIEMLTELRKQVEDCYRNWFLTGIGLAWNKHVDACLPDRWECMGVLHQHRFYSDNVEPWLRSSGQKRRAWVIVSDALRYEVGKQLSDKLHSEPRLSVKLTSQLGVLPSYTSLGMASLLPHRELSYGDRGDVLVDGKPSASLEQRNSILGAWNGIAITAEDLSRMGRAEVRQHVADASLVYVYHDEIDATGDSARTESDTFKAVARAVNTLSKLTKRVVTTLDASFVVITADHGFIYTDSKAESPDKSQIRDQPLGTVISKKRYLLGRALPKPQNAWRGHTRVTAGASGDMQFWIPKGSSRFHFSGGARFIHGGAMLQEIVVPVIKVRQQQEKVSPKLVDVQVLGSKHRITTPKHRFSLVQTEPITDSVLKVTLKIAIYERDQPVTDIQTVTFASESRDWKDRQNAVVLTLRDHPYNKRTKYQLVLRNVQTGVTQETPVTIDRAIVDDF